MLSVPPSRSHGPTSDRKVGRPGPWATRPGNHPTITTQPGDHELCSRSLLLGPRVLPGTAITRGSRLVRPSTTDPSRSSLRSHDRDPLPLFSGKIPTDFGQPAICPRKGGD